MTTIDDKLKLFTKVVFEKVEKDSQQKVMNATSNYDRFLEQEKRNILMESENMIKQMKRKAESKKEQIISKANIDRQHALLKKRKELFDRTVEDIKDMAERYTLQPEYIGFLEKCIKNCLLRINAPDVVMMFIPKDIERHGDKIKSMIDKYKMPDMNVSVMPADGKILGGCICEDMDRTIRVNCSMLSIIDDNRAVIGKMLVDNIGQSR